MKQIEIEYFFPLTEQISLDLDFSASNAYEEEKRKEYLTNSTSVLYTGVGLGSSFTTASTIQFRPTNESVGYWQIGEGIQMHNEIKPNWLHQIMSKLFFGWKWKDK